VINRGKNLTCPLGHVEIMPEKQMPKRMLKGDYSSEEGRDEHEKDGWTMW
jgi:hypothetical protein